MKKSLAYVVIVVVFASCLAIFHGPLVTNLNGTLLGDQTDGIKNYFTPIYHIQNAESASIFKGMNYPYGDQVVFSDNQPTLSIPLFYLSKIAPQIKQNVVGIMNGLMLLSILITAFLLFKIVQFYVPNAGIKEALFSIMVALLSPQLLRLGGHYALSYGFAIPLVWWRLLCYVKTPRVLNSLYIGLVVLLLGGLHLYYIALTGGFIFLFHLFHCLFSAQGWLHIKKTIAHLGLQLLVPVSLLLGWIQLTQHSEHRTHNPLGFLENTAFLESVFLPIGMPLEWKFKTFIPIRPVPWEGLSYVGLFATLFCLLAIPIMILFRNKLQNMASSGIKKQTLRAVLITSILFLAYSFGFPFYYDMEHLLPLIGPLKQFRGIGRFAWVFFYVINIVAFVSCTVWLQKYKWLLWFPIALLANDVWAFHEKPFYHQNRSAIFSHQSNITKHWTSSINPASFQAILPLPFYHTGSEYLLLESQGSLLKQSMEASVATGLPLFAVQMSRTDIEQTLQLVSLITEPLSIPLVLQDMPNTKPLLLMYDKRLELTKSQALIRDASSLIVENDSLYIASFNPFSFFKKAIKQKKNDAKKAQQNAILLSNKTAISDTNLYYFVQQHAQTENFKSFKTIAIDKKWTSFEEIHFSFKDSLWATVSMWINIQNVGAPATNMIVEGKNTIGEIVQWHEFPLKHHITAIEKGWALIEVPLLMTKGLDYGFFLHNPRLKEGINISRFMLWEQGQQIIVTQQPYPIVNNRFYE